MTEFVKAEEKQGKKYTQVAEMIDILRKAKKPVPFKDLCEQAGVKYEQDVQAAMFSLELVKFIDRYTYVEEGSTRKQTAYALNKKAGSVPPTRGASGASSASLKKPAAKRPASSKSKTAASKASKAADAS